MPSQTVAEENSTTRIAPPVVLTAPWRIRAISVLPDYRLAVTFLDGSEGIVDCSSILTAENPGIFLPLADRDFFARVRVELGAPTWPNGADLDPSWLYENVLGGGETWAVPF